jgi:hypothetical protein
MFGLILKDYYTIQKQLKFYLIMIGFFIFLGISNNEDVSYMFMIAFFAIMLPMTALAYDERSNWFKYALTMPLNRKNLVMSKYALGGLFVLVAFVFNEVLSVLLIGLGNMGVISARSMSLLEMTTMAGTSALVSIFFLAVIMPIFFKLGVETGRIAMMGLFFIPSIVVFLVLKFVPTQPAFIPTLINTVETYAFLFELLGVVVVILSLFLSIWISVKIFEKKEF